ncbi:shufflon system plasmid conjugative transfer pilus tip adhesin PilV [Cupriavidus basilensis]|uniref:shufflon system plasmid conjugative transfer pilus tip adhesin PilV n=1 Tax=Cupriavidus basilensis TaxID=68895 RepID=UPI0023E7621D|nr:shufflon system plasmid conjugative transfer pilus tip adhesin PilV [Cupriavidus basilensis]MDF3883107.1 shufflon system plasmid conjugative transfer pilus tip adhesin PilV [Cupriavidus basilensis]
MDAILGTVVALVISMLSLGGIVAWGKVGVENVQTAATANQMLIFNKATQQYVQDYGTQIASTATATVPVTISAATLAAAGYLPSGTSGVNPFGQTWQAQVLQPTPGSLQTLVSSQGGNPISNTKQLVQIAAQAGAQGGYVPYPGQAGDATLNANTAYGSYGAWKLPMANYTNPGSGHLASLLAFTNVQSNNSYLYRVQVPGHPELNQMQTSIDLKGNDLNNVGKVNAQTATVSSSLTSNGENYLNAKAANGTACSNTTLGSIRTNTNGSGLVICDGALWQPIGTAVSGVANGMACAGPGKLATGSDQRGYVCRGGVYVSLDTAFGTITTLRKINNVTDGMTFGKDSCPGGTAWALFTPANFIINVTGDILPPIQGAYFMAIDQGATWYAQASGRSPSAWYGGNNTGALGGQLVGTLTTGCAY